jgi:large subunit ribosomal protein L18
MSVRTKEDIRERLHKRLRKKVAGTTGRPRLAVFRSQGHIYAQIIDDDGQKTIAAASSLDKGVKSEFKRGSNIKAAQAVGKLIAERAKEKGIQAVVFDRGGFQYHGRIKALADAARESGLKF